MWNCDPVTCQTAVYPTYHDHKRLAQSIEHLKRILSRKKVRELIML